MKMMNELRVYSGNVSKEVDEALFRAEKAGAVVIPLVTFNHVPEGAEPDQYQFLAVQTKTAFGTKYNELYTVAAFLREFGKH